MALPRNYFSLYGMCINLTGAGSVVIFRPDVPHLSDDGLNGRWLDYRLSPSHVWQAERFKEVRRAPDLA